MTTNLYTEIRNIIVEKVDEIEELAKSMSSYAWDVLDNTAKNIWRDRAIDALITREFKKRKITCPLCRYVLGVINFYGRRKTEGKDGKKYTIKDLCISHQGYVKKKIKEYKETRQYWDYLGGDE